ncbi:CapA family protein [Salinibacter ruber]|uniref:CapA family protein n=1 Tax=Salinibacter ruber TaxID=146919 RepID=UPI00216950FE|nr:CapA family protein [Salinibacter ruber]MCS3824363.1 poly-gamma-glutamate synthesis protein (capsule biosynthesis protein) [Salinibacter ruber]
MSLAGDVWLNLSKKLKVEAKNIENNALLANLETPIVGEEAQKRKKAGPNLRGSSRLINKTFTKEKLYFNLSNNHVMDYGKNGLENTLEWCNKNKIPTVGAGLSYNDARRALVIEEDGQRIGILGRCERQFGGDLHTRGGVAVVDPSVYPRVRSLAEKADLVIVSLHGGSELCPWPSPVWRDRCRALIDAGASVVHGHHAHVPQGYETYREGVIFYGLGNFVAPPERWTDTPNALWSIVPTLAIRNGELSSWKIETVVLEDLSQHVLLREATQEERRCHREYLDVCNEPLSKPEKLEALWQEVSVRLYRQIYQEWLDFNGKETTCSGIKSLWRHLGRRLLHFVRSDESKKEGSINVAGWKTRLWFHLFACESHREAISVALGVLGNEYDDLRSKWTKRKVNKMMPWTV